MDKPTLENFVSWNNEMAQRHDPDLYHRESPWPVRMIEKRRVSVLIKLLQAGQNDRVLEVGCGAGNVLERVGPSQKVGIDLSPFLLAKAADRLGDDGTLFQMNAQDLSFADNSFTRIYCTEVLEHVLDPSVVLSEMKRVLSADGIAVVSVPNEALINRLKGIILAIPGARKLLSSEDGYDMPDHMEDEWHLHEFDREVLEKSIAGLFKITAIRGIPSRALPLRWVAQLSPKP